MSDCCHDKGCALAALRQRQAKVLWIVLAINAVMFVVELTAGLRANSLSLAGDSLDMLGDALVYGSSLYVLERSARAQAKSAFLKGNIMALSAIAIFARACYQLARGTTPSLAIMSAIGLLVLAANLVCLALLTRHRADNLNMSAVWLCSRNDIIANTAVLGAAGLVALTNSFWPDLLVGLLIAAVFAKSAGKVLAQSWQAMGQV